MSNFVLDASALLASIFEEPGGDKAESYFAGALISSVNVAEVFSTLSDKNKLSDKSIEAFDALELEIVDFDLDQARKAAELRPLTRHLGMSLADRCCIGLAILNDATAVTADRQWAKLSFCAVKLIR